MTSFFVFVFHLFNEWEGREVGEEVKQQEEIDGFTITIFIAKILNFMPQVNS